MVDAMKYSTLINSQTVIARSCPFFFLLSILSFPFLSSSLSLFHSPLSFCTLPLFFFLVVLQPSPLRAPHSLSTLSVPCS
ncbi:MAG: hypothetical protein JOS17DRAFT_505187 [Linnemannia elongata]|nr:MAG: hypothetical protein JOS17DRAFT_505187 [Linnemannia elongata]